MLQKCTTRYYDPYEVLAQIVKVDLTKLATKDVFHVPQFKKLQGDSTQLCNEFPTN